MSGSHTPEGKVKTKVKGALYALRAWWFMPVQTGRGVAGVPDFIACVPTVVTSDMVGTTVGLFVGVETKAPGKINTVTPLQTMQIRRIREAAGIAIVTDGTEPLCISTKQGGP